MQTILSFIITIIKKVLGEKAEDMREPSDEETDVLIIDSIQSIDPLTPDIMERIGNLASQSQLQSATGESLCSLEQNASFRYMR